MIHYFIKALWLLRTRPVHFKNVIRSLYLFRRTKLLQPFFFGKSSGVLLETNVRIQRIRTLCAERPEASIKIGADSIVYENARIEAYGQGQIHIGKTCVIGDARIYSRGKITIGSRVITSWNVFIQDFDPHPTDPELRSIQMQQICDNFKPSYKEHAEPKKLNWTFPSDAIVIGDDVWIGANATILKGAKIGAGCVIATGSVVTAGDYPARSILAGVPAKVIKVI
ncbi:MAG: acyltransferase [Bacteriovoracaceae bacterium]|nr:acyltransferase [Bacteriovoracaceae bacterium]